MGLHEVSSDPAALVMLRHGMEESREHSPAPPSRQDVGIQNVEFLVRAVVIYLHPVIDDGTNQLIT
jgi:hypothetical protein